MIPRSLLRRGFIDAAVWEKSAGSEIDQATDFYEAYALAGYQALRVLDVMTMAVSPTLPQTVEETTDRANEPVASRLKAIAVRFAVSERSWWGFGAVPCENSRAQSRFRFAKIFPPSAAKSQ